MQISWDDVNRTETKGIQFVARLGIDVFVTTGAIRRWKADPDCHHRLVEISTGLGKMYGLGACEPSDNLCVRGEAGNVFGPGLSPPSPEH
jgi:hypothetical protein